MFNKYHFGANETATSLNYRNVNIENRTISIFVNAESICGLRKPAPEVFVGMILEHPVRVYMHR